MKGRHISSNIRLVIDLVQYSNLLNGDPLILFLDFRKAFDTVSHNFIFDSLKFFGFRQYFIKSVKTMYCGSNSSIKLANGTSPRFEINRGIRQGCPISAFLFLVVAQVLSNMKINIPSRVLQFMKDKLKHRNLLMTQLFFLVIVLRFLCL